MPRNIQDIIPPSRRKTMAPDMIPAPRRTAEMQIPPTPPNRPSRLPTPDGYSSGKRFPYVTALGALIVIALSVGALFYFRGAQVKITPHQYPVTVSGEYVATASAGDLPFEVITVEKTGSKAVPAESTEEADDPAMGTITVLNESGEPQQFVKNTRFETPEGLIFKAREAISIPTGTTGSPGTVNISVYAEAGGEEYNVGPTTFTLPGLKNSAMYKQVTARSEKAMEGGFSGMKPSVSEATKEAQFDAIESALRAELETETVAQVKEGYSLLPGASFFTFEPQPDTSGDQGTVNVRVRGVVHAVILPTEPLARAIGYQAVASYQGEPVTLNDVSGLTVTPALAVSPVGTEEFSFTLGGSAILVWKIDPTVIAGAVAGKKKEAARTILSGLPEVGEAEIVLRPFWSSSFPTDPGEIKVSLMGDERND